MKNWGFSTEQLAYKYFWCASRGVLRGYIYNIINYIREVNKPTKLMSAMRTTL